MIYMGGKHSIRKGIRIQVDKRREPGQRFVDMFCGALSVSAEVNAHGLVKGPHVANDGFKGLKVLFEAVRSGWVPEFVEKAEWYELKRRMDLTDPQTVFSGFGQGFGGKFFQGYAHSNIYRSDWVYYDAAKRGLARKVADCVGVEFTDYDYRDFPILPGDLVYCDPPYEGTAGYTAKGKGLDAFDTAEFLKHCERWKSIGARILISEYQILPGCKRVAEWSKAVTLQGGESPQKLEILNEYIGS